MAEMLEDSYGRLISRAEFNRRESYRKKREQLKSGGVPAAALEKLRAEEMKRRESYRAKQSPESNKVTKTPSGDRSSKQTQARTAKLNAARIAKTKQKEAKSSAKKATAEKAKKSAAIVADKKTSATIAKGKTSGLQPATGGRRTDTVPYSTGQKPAVKKPKKDIKPEEKRGKPGATRTFTYGRGGEKQTAVAKRGWQVTKKW